MCEEVAILKYVHKAQYFRDQQRYVADILNIFFRFDLFRGFQEPTEIK